MLVAAVAVGAATLSLSRDARALGPIDLEVAAKGGYGTNPFSVSPNPLGAGLGARAGVGIFGLYAGLAILYYFGGSEDTTLGKISDHSLMYGVEAGYNWKITLLTIRPQLGVGNYTLTAGTSGSSASHSNLYLEPGVTALVSLGMMFVGADANLLVLPSIQQPDGNKSTDTAFTLHGQLGVKF